MDDDISRLFLKIRSKQSFSSDQLLGFHQSPSCWRTTQFPSHNFALPFGQFQMCWCPLISIFSFVYTSRFHCVSSWCVTLCPRVMWCGGPESVQLQNTIVVGWWCTTRICETSRPPHFLDHLWSLWKFVHKSTMWLRWQLLKNFLDPGGPLHARALWSWTFLSFIFGFKMTWEVIKSYGPIVTSLFLCHVTFSSSSSCSCWAPPGCPSWSTPQSPARI